MSLFKMPTPKMPPAPALPQSPLDKQVPIKSDATATAYKSLISTSPMGETKPAIAPKKTLLGGTK